MLNDYLRKHWAGWAHDLCVKAEEEIIGKGRGEERMHACISWLRAKLPWYIRWLVSEQAIKALIQSAFDAAEDELAAIADKNTL